MVRVLRLGWIARVFLPAFLVIMGLWLSLTATVQAVESTDAEVASTLFTVHCAGCHPNGGNIIRRGKSLKERALRRQGLTSVADIATLVTQGEGLMSSYRDRLSAEEIDLVSTYVWQQAQQNWQ